MTGKQTFRGFVTCMNNRYQRWNPFGTLFMSLNTFIEWWFGWASRMNIDFRVPCRACGGNSNILACDGTKIGYSFKNILVEPIESFTSENVIETKTRRNDRSFLRGNNESKLLLKNICRKISRNEEVLESYTKLEEHLPESCVSLFRMMVCVTTVSCIRISCANFFRILAGDCSIDVVFPYVCAVQIQTFIQQSVDLMEISNFVMNYCPELSSLITVLSNRKCHLLELSKFIGYLAQKVLDIHKVNVQPEDVAIVAPYNPAKYGRAYYFENHGCQVRSMRKFSIDQKSSSNYDDLPSHTCNKKFPTVSKKGVSYLFL